MCQFYLNNNDNSELKPPNIAKLQIILKPCKFRVAYCHAACYRCHYRRGCLFNGDIYFCLVC